MSVEIFYNNLDEETQKELLNEFGIEKPEDMNWDTIPITIIEGGI